MLARQVDRLSSRFDANASFEVTARDFHATKKVGWSDHYAKCWMERLEKDIFPWLGKLPLSRIGAPMLLQTLRRVEARGTRELPQEDFSESAKAEQAERRRARLSVLQPHDGRQPLAVVLGEFKGWESAPAGARIWIRHIPDAPLLADARTWARVQRSFAPLFEALDSDGARGLRLMLAALIRARREHTYEIDLASLMLTREEWIPLEGVHEAPLVRALAAQGRRFVKPLRYDARTAAGFANALLLDAGAEPVGLHVVSAYMRPLEHEAKCRALAHACGRRWVWSTEGKLPDLPAAVG